MADPHLLTLLGVDGPAGGALDPGAVLAALGADPRPTETVARPRVPADETWLRVSALPPASGDGPGPFATVLASAGGGLAELTVLVHHGDSTGLRVYVSGGHPAISERVRNQLAPYCDVVAAPPPRQWTGWRGFGVRYRVQAELGRAADARPAGRAGLLERMSSVPGDWCAVLSLRSVHQLEIRDAQQGVVGLGEVAAASLTSTRQEAATRTVTTVSAAWSRVQDWLGVLAGQLAQGGSGGLWKAGVWAFGRDEWTVHQTVAALRGAVPEEQGRRVMAYDLPVDDAASAEPLSVLTTPEAAALLDAPRASTSGLAVRPAPPAARRPDGSAASLTLGRYWSTDIPATIGLTDLEGHAFVTGTTGSGKTTTLHRLLADAWNVHGVPFLVLDPVKDEYSSAAGLFRGGLTTVSGGELCLNLMAPWPGEDARQHVAQVAQAFRAAFTMPSPTPYVVTQLFDQVAAQPGGPAGTELFDVRDSVDPLVLGLGYAAEAQTNIRASLLTRLNVLLAPARAHRFAWPESTMVEALFQRPAVVTLADLVDEEERSFVVLLLALATWSRARTRKNPRPVEHLLVLEEAHRVVPEVSTPVADVESGSAMAASARLLTSMLAEVRGYGQQVVVVDQSPSKVATDVVRNTNLKIVHRVVAADDQTAVGAALGLPADQAGVLGSLARGQAVVSTRREVSPQTVRVEQAVAVDPSARAAKVPVTLPEWPCCGAESPERHFRAWRSAEVAEPAMALFLLGCRVGEGPGADDAREESLLGLQAYERSLGTRSSCLAWAGLRRLLVAERTAGLLATAPAVAAHLAGLYAVWAAEEPPTTEAAKRHSVPRTGLSDVCPYCRTVCRVRVPAWIYAQAGPRSGLPALASPGWRGEVVNVADWAATERRRLATLLGAGGADTVLRCQVQQAVHRYRLTQDVADHLLKRAGVTQP